MHHIITDDWSLAILFREVAHLYTEGATGISTAPLPSLPIQYADYAVWQRQNIRPEIFDDQLNYWKKKLAGLPAGLKWLAAEPDQSAPGAAGATEEFELSKELSESLRAFANREGLTMFMALLAGYQALLHHFSGESDVVVGTPSANRNRVELEPMIGFFVNTLALRINMDGNPSFRELMQRVRETTLDAFSNQDAPFELVVKELRPQRELTRHPLFQVWFTLQSAQLPDLKMPGLATRFLSIEGGAARFDLALLMYELPTGLRGVFEYRKALFGANEIRKLVRQFEAILNKAVHHPELALRSLLDELNEAERRQPEAKNQASEEASRRLLKTTKRRTGVSSEATGIRDKK
jgi:hypothetical protein